MRVDLKTIHKVRYDINRLGSPHVSEYYKEMILWFSELTGFVKEPVNGTEVRRQPLWCNAAIQVQGKSLFNRPLWNSGVKLIDDFVDRNGNVLSYGAFMQRHPFVRVNYLIYMGWGQAIPVEWRRMLKFSCMLTEAERLQEPEIEVNGKKVPLRLLKASYFNAALALQVKPTAQSRWEKDNVNFGDKWRNIYLVPYMVTTSTRLQSLQFKIIHRFFPTRRYLCVRKVTDNPFCSSCGIVESLEHYFYECIEVVSFWTELQRALNAKLPFREQVAFTCHEVLFGRLCGPDVINLIILVAKQFIARQKMREGLINFALFRHDLQKMFNMERAIAYTRLMTDTFRRKWKFFVNVTGAFVM